jgi:hypothetical protein
MASEKKLQVFVSSTYEDMREERQAAVEAILSAGHIPAGMELFSAGDQTQTEVIRQWIEESDIFLLLLGGRYGSLEPAASRSYIHLEYEYAVSRSMPFFAVVITDAALEAKVKQHGSRVLETDHPDRYREFKQLVATRMVRFWSDPKDIKLAIHETLGKFSRRPDLRGWIPGDQRIDSGVVAEQIAMLAKENNELRERLAREAGVSYNGLTYEQMYALLANDVVSYPGMEEERSRVRNEILEEITAEFGDPAPRLIHAFWYFRNDLLGQDGGAVPLWDADTLATFDRLKFFGLVREEKPKVDHRNFVTTEDGKRFLLRLMVERQEAAGAGERSAPEHSAVSRSA